jgi:hypothetical protein
MSRNPYEADTGPPILRNSVFVYMDILGYAEQIESSEKSGTQQELLNSLYTALSEARVALEDKSDALGEIKKIIHKDLYALKAFTDNIVIGWPIHDDAESEFGAAFSKVVDFQFSMVVKGFFVRGAVAIGNAYIDDIAVFGDALTQTHHGESMLARDPRIILMKSAVDTVKSHLTYYHSPGQAPQARELLQDSDGQWFVNYLEYVLFAEYECGPFYEALMEHKSAVEKKLDQYRDNPRIFSKYAWVAGYHNFFCDLHSNYFDGEHKINTDLFRATPKLIVD